MTWVLLFLALMALIGWGCYRALGLGDADHVDLYDIDDFIPNREEPVDLKARLKELGVDLEAKPISDKNTAILVLAVACLEFVDAQNGVHGINARTLPDSVREFFESAVEELS